ncbi:65-kDa microtubule-associated protein 4 [Morus notabilis]|uniref:65-kDa microtubule-associated protein 4 n=1 Tax=Morus notabilis TaxID=981085 RepID=UPI000CECE885|nr:65-kDa microtubule-associated protein 4 [Morus notabilis]
MRRRKIERKNKIFEVMDQLEKISNDLSGSIEDGLYKMVVDETDLSLKRLEELRALLLDYQNEKRNRQTQVEELVTTLNLLCLVLGVDFKSTICEIHPTLNDSKAVKDISNNTINSLTGAVERLREVKKKRWEKLQNFVTSLLELWNLMDIPMVEQNTFHNVTCKIAASVSEITETNMLSVEFLNQVSMDATWETVAVIRDQFLAFNLEDKVVLMEGSNDRSPPIKFDTCPTHLPYSQDRKS